MNRAEKIAEALVTEASIWNAAARLRSMAFMLAPECGMAKQSAESLYELTEKWLAAARSGNEDAERLAAEVWAAAKSLEAIRLEFHRVTETIHKVHDRLQQAVAGTIS